MTASTTRRTRSAYRGCLLGGALGDALGAPVEFMTLAQIQEAFGPVGVVGLEPEYGRCGAITDDTQLTLFTAEALLRWAHRTGGGDEGALAEVGLRAYRRWLLTQGEEAGATGTPGWLLGVEELHARRAPGLSCLSALRAGPMGTPARPINGSKGCGGVMRAAPVGLARLDDPFQAGCALAALTHGHPTGYLAAGYLAQVVAELGRGGDLSAACQRASRRLAREPGHEETLGAVNDAFALAAALRPAPLALETLGGGWVAEEALAIALYCALTARDVPHGLLLAVNHGGDSDSTGAIAGNLLGLLAGEDALPARWLEELELREVVAAVADDLWAHFGDGAPDGCGDDERYPAD
jgi:ADP-ribosylglycohydrolase